MKLKQWLKSPWTISLVTAIFSLLLTMVYDYAKENPIFNTIKTILNAIFSFIILVLNINVKVWWILIAIVAIVLFAYILDRINDKPTKPFFCDYTEDRLKSWKWSWEWNFSTYKNSWHVSKLTAHCPICDTPLVKHDTIYGIVFDCPRCSFKAQDQECEEPYKIESLILDNIDRKKKSLEN